MAKEFGGGSLKKYAKGVSGRGAAHACVREAARLFLVSIFLENEFELGRKIEP